MPPATVVAAARAAFGHLDALVVNHARSGRGTLDELTAAHIDAYLAENVRASLLLVKEFAAQHDNRPGGRVVVLTSGQHLAPMTREVAYAVSKGALHQATATLSDALIDRGITVNTVNPGPTDTGWEIRDWNPAPAMPLGRWGQPTDAANLISWLCSDDAQWVTGQVINSEGRKVTEQVVATKGKPTLQPCKTAGSNRKLTLDEETVQILRDHRDRQKLEGALARDAYEELDLVFSNELGHPLSPQATTRAFHTVRSAAKVRTGRLLDLRRRSCHLLNSGVPTGTVSAGHGHSSPS